MGQPITIGTGMFDLKQDAYKSLVYGNWSLNCMIFWLIDEILKNSLL